MCHRTDRAGRFWGYTRSLTRLPSKKYSVFVSRQFSFLYVCCCGKCTYIFRSFLYTTDDGTHYNKPIWNRKYVHMYLCVCVFVCAQFSFNGMCSFAKTSIQIISCLDRFSQSLAALVAVAKIPNLWIELLSSTI